jgi:hypothetical protein
MMSKALEKARQQFQAGRDKQAVGTLYEVAVAPDAPRAEIDGLIELATAIRARNGDSSLQSDCDAHIDRARKRLAADEQSAAAARVAQLRAELDEPVRLARWAAQAGLGWLEVTSADDVVAASQSRAMAAAADGAAAHEQCLIDLVEAEGWRLEHVVHRFVATRVQTSILRGADLLGGDAVEGDEQYFYLFRRVADTSQRADRF